MISLTNHIIRPAHTPFLFSHKNAISSIPFLSKFQIFKRNGTFYNFQPFPFLLFYQIIKKKLRESILCAKLILKRTHVLRSVALCRASSLFSFLSIVFRTERKPWDSFFAFPEGSRFLRSRNHLLTVLSLEAAPERRLEPVRGSLTKHCDLQRRYPMVYRSVQNPRQENRDSTTCTTDKTFRRSYEETGLLKMG